MNYKIIAAVIALLICWSLTYSIWNHSRQLTCDKCVVRFSQTESFGMKLKAPREFEVKMMELYESYKNNQCKVGWTNTDGYILG